MMCKFIPRFYFDFDSAILSKFYFDFLIKIIIMYCVLTMCITVDRWRHKQIYAVPEECTESRILTPSRFVVDLLMRDCKSFSNLSSHKQNIFSLQNDYVFPNNVFKLVIIIQVKNEF